MTRKRFEIDRAAWARYADARAEQLENFDPDDGESWQWLNEDVGNFFIVKTPDFLSWVGTGINPVDADGDQSVWLVCGGTNWPVFETRALHDVTDWGDSKHAALCALEEIVSALNETLDRIDVLVREWPRGEED